MVAMEDLEQGMYNVHVPQGQIDVDIIAVPGLGTHPTACWGAPDPKESFNWITSPDGLAATFPTARILRYSYASAWRGQFKIKKDFDASIVNGLCFGLKAEREKLHSGGRPVIFIGHSMGGLVVAQALNELDRRRDLYGDILPCVTGCLFFGVPFNGTSFTALPKLLEQIEDYGTGSGSHDSLLRILEPGFRNPYLRKLREDFKELAARISPGIQLLCFYEELDIDAKRILSDLGLAALVPVAKLPAESVLRYFSKQNGSTRLVDQFSATCVATRGGGTGLQVGHSNLVKFRSANDERYALVLVKLRELVDNAKTHARKRFTASRLTSMSAGAVDALRNLLSSDVNRKHEAALATLGKKSWILQERPYKEWEDLSMRGVSCLWLTASGGMGKTSISLSAVANIRESNREQVTKSKHVPLLTFFLCDTTPLGSSPLELLKALLIQLINQNPLVADYAKHLLAQREYRKDSSFSEQQSDTSKNDMRATMSLQNLWGCLHKIFEDESFGDIYIIINNIHLLTRNHQTELLISFIHDYVATHPGPGPASSQGPARRWLFTSVQRGGGDRFKQLMSACHVADLTANEYADKVKNSLEEHVVESVEKLHQEKGYKRDQVYMIQDLIKMNASGKNWIDIQYIRLRALSQGSSTETITKILSPADASDLTSLVRYCWQAIIGRDPEDQHNLTELLRALALAFRPLSILELSVLSDIRNEDKVEELIQRCEPMLELVSQDQNTPTVKFGNTTLKAGFLWESTELVNISPEEVPVDTQGQAQGKKEQHPAQANAQVHDEQQDPVLQRFHGVLAMRCFSYMEHSGVKNPRVATTGEPSGTAIQGEDDKSERTYFGDFWMAHAIRGKPELAKYISKDLRLFWAPESPLRTAWLRDLLPAEPSFSDGSSYEGMTGLHTAAFFGYDLLLEELVRSGHQAEIGVFNKDGHTPLHIASMYNHVKAVQVLLNYTKEDAIDMTNGENGTALHVAAIQGHIETLKLLLDNKADPNAFCEKFGPVINAAILSGNNNAVSLLLDDPRHNLEAHKAQALSPLALSAARSEPEVFTEILTKNKHKWTSEDYRGALHESCLSGRPKSVQALRMVALQYLNDEVLQNAMLTAAVWDHWGCVSIVSNIRPGLAGRNIFYLAAVTGRGGKMAQDVLHKIWAEGGSRIVPREVVNAALYQATDNKKSDTVRWLLDSCHADADATDHRPVVLHHDCFKHAPEQRFGNALTAAAWDGSLDIVEMLLQKGAEVDSANGCALQMAAQEGYAEVVQLLLDHGAKINRVIDGPGTEPGYQGPEFPEATALQAACQYDRVQVVQVLLGRKRESADPNLGGGIYERPIFAATRRNLLQVLKLLLAAPSIDVNVAGGRDLSTPLINAACFMSVKAAEALIEAGADVNQVDSNGDTAVILAARRGDATTLKLLIEHDASFLHESPQHKFAFQIAAKNGHVECMQVLANKVSIVCRALTKVAVSNSSMRDLLARPEGDDHHFADVEEINALQIHAQDLKQQLAQIESYRQNWQKMEREVEEAKAEAQRCNQERLEAVRLRQEDKSTYDLKTDEYNQKVAKHHAAVHGFQNVFEKNEKLKEDLSTTAEKLAAAEERLSAAEQAHSVERLQWQAEMRAVEAAWERQGSLTAEKARLGSRLEALERPAESSAYTSPKFLTPTEFKHRRPSSSSLHSQSTGEGQNGQKTGGKFKASWDSMAKSADRNFKDMTRPENFKALGKMFNKEDNKGDK
ncbi:hypothetical protein PspLS_01007 [Pyricularia sp. CBS 133598]|nr:hypothetical protein PspLS_01007 [Pyricularia sp. CBS 133598]